ncbi:Rieske 2Fe-2S domain-containing protein [Geminocystis sp. CENA526]|uniref:aromatic ring-hydroxylating dioxygenase subunit alpha n=1 Tax=Geminocystis sp. CENA526 TaxID=1355871 RepID=UPI003D6F9372
MGQLDVKPNIRTCGINLNHWYVVASSEEVKKQPLGVTLWHKSIVLFRNEKGEIQALDDRCPHRQVKLSDGQIVGNDIECAYHGWRFDGEGKCSFVPYLTEKQKLPSCQLKRYPVQELDGFIWLFAGDGEAQKVQPMGLPEWHHLNYIGSMTSIDCPGHFSFLIENLMDMYHGHLHDNYQAWACASLKDITTEFDRVEALYDAQSYYRIDKIWSISQLFFPSLRRLHPEPLTVSYVYPHWRSTLGKDFKIYCLFCPINETTTKAYLVHFTSLEAFHNLHKLPVKFRRFLKNSLFGTAKGLLDGLVRQDVAMIKQEQEAFLNNPFQRLYELNPAIAQVQNLILSQSNIH